MLNGVAVLAGLAVWGALTAGDVVGLPGPWEVLQRAGTSIRSGQLPSDMMASLARVLTGFVLGGGGGGPRSGS